MIFQYTIVQLRFISGKAQACFNRRHFGGKTRGSHCYITDSCCGNEVLEKQENKFSKSSEA